MSNKKDLLISSLDKTNYADSNSRFIFKFGERYELQNIKSITLKGLLVPNVFYNIRDGTNGKQNNTLIITETGQPDAVITIPEGQYTISDFMTELKNQLDANLTSGVSTVTQNLINKKINISFSVTTVILKSNLNGSTMGSVLGLKNTTTALLNHIMDYMPNLNGYDIVYVHSQELANKNAESDSGTISVLGYATFDKTPFGGYSYLAVNDDTLFNIVYKEYRNISTIGITLRDDQGTFLDIGMSNMYIMITCEY